MGSGFFFSLTDGTLFGGHKKKPRIKWTAPLSLSTGCIYFLLHYPFLLKYTQEPIFPRKNLSPQKKKYSRGPKRGWLFIGKLRVWPSSDTLGFNGGRKEKRVKKNWILFRNKFSELFSISGWRFSSFFARRVAIFQLKKQQHCSCSHLAPLQRTRTKNCRWRFSFFSRFNGFARNISVKEKTRRRRWTRIAVDREIRPRGVEWGLKMVRSLGFFFSSSSS